jgi:signal transduction histidine kinase
MPAEKGPSLSETEVSRPGRRMPLERRLFLWLFAVGAVPAVVILLLAWALSAGSLGWLGGLGAWDPLAASGRELLEAVGPAAATDPAVAEAADRHRDALGVSLVQAQRWSYIGARLRAALPWLFIGNVVAIGLLAFWVARLLARGFSRPIRELVDWSERLGRDEPLPAAGPAEAKDPAEIVALRGALREAAVALRQARRRDLEAERLRAWGELARRVAHEMKNPLTPLRLAAHRLARIAAADERVVEPLDVITAESARLEALAAEFGALGRPPAGAPSDVDLRELCERLLESDVPAGIARTLEVEGAEPIVHGHYDSLLRALRNVIGNAVEAVSGRAGAAIDVAIVVRGEAVSITIGDNGIGVPPAMLERIFDPDVTLKRAGTGLGLAIVRQAVSAHGGRVAARARADGGAEFVMEIPSRTPALDAGESRRRTAGARADSFAQSTIPLRE